jgi:group I intron endonuclease
MRLYIVQHRLTRKAYVGQTIQQIPMRWASHCHRARLKHVHGHLHRAIRKDSPAAFIVTELMECRSMEELNFWEIFFISAFRSAEREFGYNLRAGGGSGGAHSEESKAKQSAKMKGRPSPIKGMNRNEIARNRAVKDTIPRNRSNPIVCPLLGEPQTKTRISNFKKKLTPEHIAKIGQANKGKKRTATVKEKIRNAVLGQRRSSETKEKIRANTIAMWARKRDLNCPL